MDIPFITSLIIFGVTFVVILSERVHRTVIAFLGAISMIVAGKILGFYTSSEVLESVDFDTILLLFGMMLIVAMLEKTGFFQYLGIFVAKKTKGDIWLLILTFGALTTVLSMILDNVTTIILIAPITLVVAQSISINPVPILIAEAFLSNIGGVGTLVGDPPNIMIGSAANFSFNDFLVYSLPTVIVVWIFILLLIKFLYRKELKVKPKNIDSLLKMDEREAIVDAKMLKKILFVLAGVIIMFFMHNSLHISPALVAVIGASVALTLVSAHHDPQKILAKVELSVLLFFASLFILVGGLEHAGVLEVVANWLIAGVEGNILQTAIIILWASAVLSAVVDNIPLTVAMIPIMVYLGTQGIDVNILWWALVFGVGFGGNASPIGATANIIVITKSEHTDTPITFKDWMKSGLIVTFVALSITTAGLIIFKDFFIG